MQSSIIFHGVDSGIFTAFDSRESFTAYSRLFLFRLTLTGRFLKAISELIFTCNGGNPSPPLLRVSGISDASLTSKASQQMSSIQGRGVNYKSTADCRHSSCAEAPLYAYAIRLKELVGCFIMSSQAADPEDHG